MQAHLNLSRVMHTHTSVRAMDSIDSREDISIKIGGLAWTVGGRMAWLVHCIAFGRRFVSI